MGGGTAINLGVPMLKIKYFTIASKNWGIPVPYSIPAHGIKYDNNLNVLDQITYMLNAPRMRELSYTVVYFSPIGRLKLQYCCLT